MLRLSAFSLLKAKRGGVFLHVEPALLNNLRIVQDVPEDLDHLVNFLRRRVVGDGHVHLAADVRSSRDILYLAVDEFHVGHACQMPAQEPKAGGTEADFFHGTSIFTVHDQVTDHERFVEEDGQRAEEVFDRILGREGYGQTGNTETSQPAGDVQSEYVLRGGQVKTFKRPRPRIRVTAIDAIHRLEKREHCGLGTVEFFGTGFGGLSGWRLA